jgi:hypothetical protein
MAKTAVVNPRGRRRKKARRRARTKHYGSARRRRRNPSSTNLSGTRRRRRRRNPSTSTSSAYSSGGYRRRPNPRRRARRRNPESLNGLLDSIIEVAPAATAGVQLGRAAFKMAGDFETIDGDPSGGTVTAPGIKHALAGVLAAEFGGKLVGDMLGSADKGRIAMHACIGWLGDQLLHKRFLRNNSFANEHLYLGDNDWEPSEDLSGFSNQSAIGSTQLVCDEAGNCYQLNGVPADPQGRDLSTLNLSGFSNRSAIGSVDSSFGYVPR